MAANAILALLDPTADAEARLDGALLVAQAMSDIALLRSVFFKLDGE